jgi:hypothetical protein
MDDIGIQGIEINVTRIRRKSRDTAAAKSHCCKGNEEHKNDSANILRDHTTPPVASLFLRMFFRTKLIFPCPG